MWYGETEDRDIVLRVALHLDLGANAGQVPALRDPGGVFFPVKTDLLGDLCLREGLSEQELLIDLSG